ncbi:MAG: alkaline phosphatase family protein [Gemmatimonadales bacterium]|nr:alkaline phosphatase family protein [Gemmatimonadales bacterium]
MKSAVVSGIVMGALLVLLAGFLVGCGGKEPPLDPEARKLVVIGLDSADWRLLKPMIEDEGRLPVLKNFMTQSSYGRMKTFFPLEKSPVLWASISTGVEPEVHGIANFVKGSDQKPVSGSAWYAPAIWDILGAANLSSSVVGMWTTYPTRQINGVMVSDYLPYGHGRDKPMEGLVYPDSLTEAVVALRVDPASLTREDLTRFIDTDKITLAEKKYPVLMGKLRDVLAADMGYVAVNRMLAEKFDFDLFYFYLRGPDMISHYFYRFLKPQDSRLVVTPEEIEIFKDVVKRYYDWSDEVTGEVLSWFPADRQTVILSDHGFYGPRKSGKKGAHEHSEWGIFLVRSPIYEANHQFSHLELLDICPTFLALMGLPPAQDMPGRVLIDGLTSAGKKRIERIEKNRVPTYLPLRPAEGPAGELDEGVNEEIRKQLRSLGYIN